MEELPGNTKRQRQQGEEDPAPELIESLSNSCEPLLGLQGAAPPQCILSRIDTSKRLVGPTTWLRSWVAYEGSPSVLKTIEPAPEEARNAP